MAKPTVVLGQGSHMQALSDSFNTILQNMERKVQIEAAKREQLDKSLIPPDVDWDNIYHKDTEYIKGLVDEYTKTATDYWSQGVNHLNPGSGEAYRKMRGMENQILSAAAQSAQDKKIDESVISTMTKKGFAESFDLPETMLRLSEFREMPLTERRNYLNGIGGFYQEAPFDWNKFTNDNLPDQPDQFMENKSTKGGYTSWTQVKGYSPETIGKIADSWLTDPKYFNYASKQYNALSDATRQLVETEAAKEGISGIQYWARHDANRKNFRQEELKYAKSANAPKSTGNGTDNNSPVTFDLAVRVGAVMAGDAGFYTSTRAINGDNYQVADFPMIKFGTYKSVFIDKNNKAAAQKQSQGTTQAQTGKITIDPKTNAVVVSGDTGSSTQGNAFKDNYLEAVVRNPRTGKIYVSTTQLNDNSQGTKGSDGLYYMEAGDNFWTAFLNGAVNGTEYSKTTLDKFVKQRDALGENGIYRIDRFYDAFQTDDDPVPEGLKQ